MVLDFPPTLKLKNGEINEIAIKRCLGAQRRPPEVGKRAPTKPEAQEKGQKEAARVRRFRRGIYESI